MARPSPIFVIGTGRSGSTIFHRLFSAHPDLAWLNRILNLHPDHIGRHRAYMRLIDVPLVGNWLIQNGLWPDEAYRYFDRAFKGFEQPFRDLRADDVTERARVAFERAVYAITAGSRQRPLIKITGWPRVGFLNEIFPEAHFIHIIRDGRSVANSLLEVEFWNGWRGPENWRFGPLPRLYHEEWLEHDKSFVVLAALGWKVMMDASIEARNLLPGDRLFELRYEDLCDDHVMQFRRVADFVGAAWSDRFERSLVRRPMSSQNEKWRKELTEAQQSSLQSVLKEQLAALGYKTDY